MLPTEAGQRFIQQARLVLRDLGQLQSDFAPQGPSLAQLKIALPRGSYVSLAAARAIDELSQADQLHVHLRECGATDALKDLLEYGCHLAVLRYPESEQEQYQRYFTRKHLQYEVVLYFRYRLLVNRESPLATMVLQDEGQLEDFIELKYDDEFLPEKIQSSERRRVSIYDRGSQFDLLRQLRDAYIWVSPMPEALLSGQGLVQRVCPFQTTEMLDVLVYPKGTPKQESQTFLRHLRQAAQEVYTF
jgi:DNA-binding transcriptional LysR family regulator